MKNLVLIGALTLFSAGCSHYGQKKCCQPKKCELKNDKKSCDLKKKCSMKKCDSKKS